MSGLFRVSCCVRRCSAGLASGGRICSRWAFASGYSLPLSHTAAIPSQSSAVAQALEKKLSPVTVECTNDTIGLIMLAVCRTLAAPHCTPYKGFELEQIEY